MELLNQVMKDMANTAQNKYRSTKEYLYYKYRREEIDRILEGLLMEDQKELIDAFLEEIDDAAQHEVQAEYLQGVRDGIGILKSLGVF